MSQMTKAIIAGHKLACRVSGETIAYRRNETVLVSGIVALPGSASAETFDDKGQAITIGLQDWLILQERLSVDGVPIVPERGDVIEVTIDNAITARFQVQHPNGNQPPWRRCDIHGTVIRVHSQAMELPAADDAGDE